MSEWITHRLPELDIDTTKDWETSLPSHKYTDIDAEYEEYRRLKNKFEQVEQDWSLQRLIKDRQNKESRDRCNEESIGHA